MNLKEVLEKMSFLKIINNPLPKKIEVPTSKSYANRALILAALDEREVTVSNISWSQDVMDMVNVLKQIGLEILMGSDFVTIGNSFPECESKQDLEIELQLGEGGTTSRFLAGFLALGQNTYILNAKNRMSTRPMQALYDALKSFGVKVESLTNDSFPVKIKGPISAHKSYDIDCSETTQFYSSLLLLTKKVNLDLRPVGLKTSIGYVEMTQQLLNNFSTSYQIPVDFSSASYPIAYAVLNQDIVLTNCFERDYFQGDSKILDVIKDAGANYFFDNEGLHICSQELNSFELDCSNCPDLVPTLSFLAAYSNGTSKLFNIANLKHKESDRIEGVLKILNTFEIPCNYDEVQDVLSITGRPKDHIERAIETEYDHRLVMTATMFLKHNSGGSISPVEATKKSYPGFFDIF